HRTQGWRGLESASVSYGKATPYFPVLDLLKRYAQVEDRDDIRTIRARGTGPGLTLHTAPQGTKPGPPGPREPLPEGHPFLHPRPTGAAPAHARWPEAGAAARKSGAAPAAGV